MKKKFNKLVKEMKSNESITIQEAISRGEAAVKSIDETYQSVKMHATIGMNVPEANPYKKDQEILSESISILEKYSKKTFGDLEAVDIWEDVDTNELFEVVDGSWYAENGTPISAESGRDCEFVERVIRKASK